MEGKLLVWDVYEISADKSEITGVKMRGKLRKWGVQNGINILVENTEDVEKRVRFAIIEGTDTHKINEFLKGVVAPDIKIELKLKGIHNPVLSKLKINHENYI